MGGNITAIHHSLNRGEVSPRIAARQDKAEFYMACCLTMQNAIPLVGGGAYWRPGTQRVATKKTVEGNNDIRLIDFVAARTAAYMLEFGEEYIRFFDSDGQVIEESPGIPFELVSPYAGADLADINVNAHSIDVKYLFHRNYPVHKISRISATEFVITEVNFNPPATIEEEPTGTDISGGTLTPDATTGSGIDFTSSATPFLGSGTDSPHVGLIIVSGASRAQIVSVTSSSVVVADIIDDFPDTNPIAADDWRLVGAPNALLDISNNRKRKGQVVTLTARNLADSGDMDTFRSTDVGKYIAIFGGMVRISVFTDASHVRAVILVDLVDITVANPAATAAWSMNIAAWSDALGYPSAGCFYQGRLFILKGLTINGSVTGDYENFGLGADDDSAIARTIDDDDVDAGVWIKGDNELKVATGSGIYQCLPTTQGGALTPSSFKVVPIDPNGSARIAPIRVMPVMLYVDASKRLLRELAYDFSSDKFRSPNVFQFAEHLVDGFFINDLAYAKDPQSVVYVVRNDGVLLGLVYDTLQSVIAWFRIVTEGDIKSVGIMPRPDTGKDWVWIAVERANGIFIEFFEPDHADTGREFHDLQTDSAVVTTHDADFVVSGLDHLEGQTVWVLGDGQLFNIERNAAGRIVSTAVVTGGEITLDPQIAVDVVEVGLGFEGRIVPVEPLLPAELGGPMIQHAYAEVGIVIQRALGLTLRAFRVNMTEPGDDTLIGEQLVYRKPYHAMDAQVPLQQGKKCITTLGYDPFARIEVGRSLPFPAEILNIHGRLHIGDRWDCETYAAPTAFSLLPVECNTSCPVGQFARVIYNGALTIGGPAIRVNQLSTNDEAFLVAALYFPTLERLSIVWYNGESNDELGTVLATVNMALEVGDVLEIKATPRVLGVIQYQAYVNDVSVLGPVGDEDIPEDAACVTFFGLDMTTVQSVITVGGVPVTVNGDPLTVTTLQEG